MDFQLMQWRNQQQSDHQQKQQVESADRKHDQHQQHQSLSALPLFLTEPVVSSKVAGNMSDMPSTSKFPKMMMMGGQQFSSAQWQELELQAVIFRYMLAGASVPAELLQPIKNSLLNSSSFFLHHPLQHFPLYHQPATSSLQSGYWGRAGMDPEPGRCRRTDGKKWRCSRDVAPGHKYCERHMNRGRNRSRKPVELPRPRNIMTPTNGIGAIGGEELRKTATSPMMGAASRGQFGSFGRGAASPSSDILHFNNNSRSPFEQNHGDGGCSDGKVLRRFFDDWPRSMAEQGSGGMNADPTSLSMSFRNSDVSLKLSTGGSGNEDQKAEKDHWMSQWGQHQAGPMGGPLAEALRSSAHP
ncbi:hypothetical protein QQ045_022293 [Rhodiola kirilowii]